MLGFSQAITIMRSAMIAIMSFARNVTVGLLFSTCGVALASELPSIKIIATGGTIAGAGVSSAQYEGYKAAVTPVEGILKSVPEIGSLATISAEQVLQVASQDLNNDAILKLAKRVNQVLQSSDTDGVVITHGTNTMEETAYFLNLVVKSSKPVVMVGSMRPGTSLSADGPMNLFRAVATAASPDSHGRGVMVVMNDQIIGARDLVKADTMTVDTFKSPVFGYLGFVVDRKPYFYQAPSRKHTLHTEFDVEKLNSLPSVGIVMGYQNDMPIVVESLVSSGVQGIIHAGAGTASVSKFMLPAIVAARSKNVHIVRVSRSSSGILVRNMEFDDDKYGTISGDTLNPAKARILLMLALTKFNKVDDIQRVFDTY